MSRFINFASNLLDGVDSMAKDSLIDQDIAAAAAERRRRRRRRKDPKQGDAFHGGSSAAEQSEGGLSEDGSHYDLPVPKQHGAAGEVEGGIGDEDRSDLVGAGATSAVRSSAAEHATAALASKDMVPKGRANNAVGRATSASAVTPPVKEDGGVWSDLAPSASSSSVPLSSHLRGSDAFVGSGNNDSGAFASSSASGTSTNRRPPRLEGGGSVEIIDPTDLERDGDGDLARREEDKVDSKNEHGVAGRDAEEGYEDDDAGSRSVAEVNSVSNTSLRVHASLSPAMSPLPLPRDFQRRQDSALEALGDEDGRGSAEGGGVGVKSGDIVEVGSAMIGPTHGAKTGSGLQGGASSFRGGGGGGGSGSRERKGLGNLLGMGGGKARKVVGDEDTEALKAEAAELREEVEELSLELEDAEDRLRGQEMELQAAAEEMKRERAEARNREGEMEREMEEFRALQAEEKKVFLANLSDVEKKLKEKDRQADEVRSALSALEAFAMEREDEAARLKHEKEELLEELKGVRSGQDRSAEELREALTRAEADREEAENRHRTWMRQAQARQTELEGTAAQLAEALAEANRRSSVADGGDGERSRGGGRGGARASGARGTYSSDRELRALRDELDSCQASLDLEQERARSLQQEVTVLMHDLEMARATEAVAEKQRQEHERMAADAFAKASRLEQQLQQQTVLSQRLGASVPTPQGSESQIQSLSSKLLDKQGRLEESVRERATLAMKLKEALERASRAEQELQESRGDSLEAGGVRSRRRPGVGGSRNSGGAAWSKLAPIAKHKKIASAVDVVDRQTLQAVVFLRNSSMARAVFLGYLLLLHLWAFVILGFHSLSMKNPQPLSNGNNAG